MRCGASSRAGESSVERVLDGGGVPLMRERVKEGTILGRCEGLLHFIPTNTRAGVIRLLCVVSPVEKPGAVLVRM